MRLLLISSEFPPGPGGIGNHAHQLALNLCRLGWEITVVSPQDYSSSEAIEEFNSTQPFPITHVSSGRGRLAEAIHRLRIAWRLAREHRPDILLGTGLSGVLVAAVLGAIRRLLVVAIAHGSEFGSGNGISGAINRRAFERMTLVVAVSQFTRSVVERAGIKPRRLEVIPNGADHRRFVLLPDLERQAFRKLAGFNGGPILLTVGHVSERKGQEVVIRALPRILQQVPATHYVMIGLPTLKPKLTQLAEQLGVRDHVHFLGNVGNHDLVKWLNYSDVFLMTSRMTENGDCEGFGIAVVEAALCGRPAIVSAQSGLIEAIQDKITGLAVPEGNEQATAEAVLSLLTDPSKRARMGQAARSRAIHEQTWDTCARKYDVILRSLMAEQEPRTTDR